MRGLTGKTVVITGAAGAIGAATATRFAEEGAEVVAIDVAAASLHDLQRAVPSVSRTVVLDVTDPVAVADAFSSIEQDLGRLDVLINNAGVNARHPFTDIPFDTWRRVMAVNLDGAFLVAQAAAGVMLRRGSGVIVNTASTNGVVGYRRHALYSAGKGALIELTRCMALDLAPSIRVNAVAPGYIQTPLMTAAPKEQSRIPLRRFGRPDEVAALFAFLSSDDAAYITGQNYLIDCGETAGGLLSDS